MKFIFKNDLYKIEIDISGSWTSRYFDFQSWIRQQAMTFNNDAITTCESKILKTNSKQKESNERNYIFFWVHSKDLYMAPLDIYAKY